MSGSQVQAEGYEPPSDLYPRPAGTLIAVGALKLPGRGRPRPLLDESGCPVPGSISEKAFADINGVRQGMFIQSEDPAHPVLLFLHGGLPEYFLTERHPTGLENDFTVVWWEQRGAGLSYTPGIPPETMTAEQFIADTLAVTGHLRERFSKQKIYLMAHSGGTFIGVQAVARTPELYHAYIGVAQTVHQLKSERVAYEYMLGRFKETGNSRLARRLEAAPVSPTGGIPDAYLAMRDKAMHRLGVGTTHDMKSVLSGVIWPSLRSPQYTLSEKIRMWRGKLSCGVSALWDEMLATDLAETVTELALPAYFFHGIYDYTVSYQLAKEYFQRLKAPLKGFYTFDRSAHSPVLEEPEKARRIMREDVLAGTNSLADEPCP
jgi:pimeloyl-ACP methyl ester carboxylesterase